MGYIWDTQDLHVMHILASLFQTPGSTHPSSTVSPRVAPRVSPSNVLPRIKRMGYNCVQLMAVAEHAHYGCFRIPCAAAAVNTWRSFWIDSL